MTKKAVLVVLKHITVKKFSDLTMYILRHVGSKKRNCGGCTSLATSKVS